MTTLNENESLILGLLYQETLACTNGEFGYMEDVSRQKFSKHEFAGYIGSLKAKGVFEYLDGSFNGQFALKENAVEALKSLVA